MKRSLIVAMIVGTLATYAASSEALACGYKPGCKPPKEYPTATPAPPTATPVPPTPVPPTPTQPPPTSVPPSTSVQPSAAIAPRFVSESISLSAPPPENESRLYEYCVWETTTQQFEIRRSTDADRFVRNGAEYPIAPHVCDQHQPTPVPVTPTPVVPVETPEIVVITVQVEEVPVTPTPEVTPVPVVEEETPEWIPEETTPCEVPVQIPEWVCLSASVSWDRAL